MKSLMFAAAVGLFSLLPQALEIHAQTSAQDTADIQSRIDAENLAIGGAIDTRDLAVSTSE